MTRRTVNTVITFTDPDAAPDPLSTQYSISTHGYKSPDSPYYYAPSRLKSQVTIEKSIGVLYWGNSSDVTFGNIDIDISDGGLDDINGEQVRWVEWAKENLNPQVVIAVEDTDGSLIHLATADGEGVYFPDDRTIRIKLRAKHARKLDQYVNDYIPADSTYDAEIQGQPVPTLLGAGAKAPPGYDPATFEPRTQFKTLLVDETVPRYMVTFLGGDLVTGSPADYFVMDRGAALYEDGSPGFTLWENGFDLTDNPDGEVTFTWIGDQGGGVEDPLETGELLQGPFRICRWAVDRAGIDAGTLFPAESDFPDILPALIGDDEGPTLSYVGEVSARQILNDCVLNLSGWWYVDEFGDFQFGRFEAPENVSPSFSFTDVEMIGDISVKVDLAPGLSSNMEYAYSPGSIDINNLAAAITSQARRKRLSQDWLLMQTTAAVPDVYETARGNPPMKMYICGQFNVRVQAELDRRWEDFYSGIRRFYSWSLPLRGDYTIPDLGDVCTIQSDKAQLLTFGALPLVINRIRYDLGAGLIHFEGWGGETEAPELPCPPLDLEAAADGESEIDLDWDEGDCGLSCELLEDGSIIVPDPMPTIPSDPDYRRITLTVEQPQVTGDSEIIFSYLDEGGSPTASTGVAWTDTEGLDGADYEVRIMPQFSSLPTTFSGDSVETWLPLTSDRSWTWEGFYDGGGWNSVGVDAALQFRKVGQEDTCTSEYTGTLQTGDVD